MKSKFSQLAVIATIIVAAAGTAYAHGLLGSWYQPLD